VATLNVAAVHPNGALDAAQHSGTPSDAQESRARAAVAAQRQTVLGMTLPFFDGTGRVAGSLSFFGPSSRLGPSQVAKFGKLLLREAQQISQVLGKASKSAEYGARSS
jgi:DNA-binding IclR family transcriptional regulator